MNEMNDYFKIMKEEITFTLTRSDIETLRVALEYLGHFPGLEHLSDKADEVRLKLPAPIVAFEFTTGGEEEE